MSLRSSPYLRQIATSLSRARGDAFITLDRQVTYAEAAAITQGIIDELCTLGVGQGSHVALLAGNVPETVLAQIAIYSLGCRLVLVPPELIGVELAAFLKQTAAELLLTDSTYLQNVSDARADVDVRLLESFHPADPAAGAIQIATHERCATFRYTGGTWGRPRVVVSSAAYYLGPILAGEQPRQERRLVCAAVTHGSGHLSSLQTLAAGDTVMLIGGFNSSAALQVMREARVSSLVVNPPMLYQLVDDPLSAGDWPQLRDVLHTGAWAAPARIAEAIQRFGPVIRQIYGMTETGGITELAADEHDLTDLDALSRCGRPMPGVEVQVRLDDLTLASSGAVGEVVVRSPKVMEGYWINDTIDRSVLKDGWLNTEDLGYWDLQGYLHIVGRSREVVITGVGSDNVYFVILEEFLRGHAGIREAAAIPIRDDAYGESIYCFLAVGSNPDTFSPALLAADIEHKLGSLYVPRGFKLVDELPRSPAGKVDKSYLAYLYRKDAK